MNVPYLTRKRPGCLRPYAAAVHDSAGRGACVVTNSPFDIPVTKEVAELPLPGGKARPFQFVVAFPADPAAISPIRRELYSLLCQSGLAAVADIAALASQELMANAVTHGCRELAPGTEVTMTATCDSQRLRLRVQDPSDDRPCVRTASEDQESGRGMLLVDTLADRWGVEAPAEGGGKTVWMELACYPTHSSEAS